MTNIASTSAILAVGDLVSGGVRALPQQAAVQDPGSEGITFAEFADVTSALLEHLAPDTVLSPVMCGSFDCIDLALRLNEFGYSGKYRAFAENIANPRMIMKEVRSQAPGLDFDIVDGATAK